MNHPELLAVPALMLVDYLLTILGAKKAAIVYRKHFVQATYELNPVWRTSVDQLRWFNPRHLAAVTLVALLLVLLERSESVPSSTIQLIAGALLGAFGVVCGRHLTNLLLFGFLIRNPREISGEVQLSMKLNLKISQFMIVGLVPVFAIVLVLLPHPYTVGTLLGVVTLALSHAVWARRANRPIIAE
ncbi:MAG: hypothetical protein GC161_06565 [Planctomycetaceae bacterium]|nr:hypothetical protein [Planctomycetaceae bacterium]